MTCGFIQLATLLFETKMQKKSMSNGPKKWSRVNFVTIFHDLYKIKLWGICNNFNQFAHLSSASGPSNDVIKMAAIAQL